MTSTSSCCCSSNSRCGFPVMLLSVSSRFDDILPYVAQDPRSSHPQKTCLESSCRLHVLNKSPIPVYTGKVGTSSLATLHVYLITDQALILSNLFPTMQAEALPAVRLSRGKALIKSLQFCAFNLTAVQCFLQVVNHSSTSLDKRNESSRAYFTQSKGIVSIERSFFQRQGPSFLAGAVCLTYVFRILSTLLCIILSCPVYYNTGISP